MTDKPVLRCSFCGKTSKEVTRLIAGPDKVFICDECTLLCYDIVKGEEWADNFKQQLRKEGKIIIEEAMLKPEVVAGLKKPDTSLDRFNSFFRSVDGPS